METIEATKPKRTLLDMTGYQWSVLFAAWLGWGFDVFDGLLFNFVAPNCVPALLNIEPGTPEAKSATLHWTGVLTTLLLVGWGIGGILFGKVCDKIGRTKTLLITMVIYAIGTGLCAIAPNIWTLALFRFIASLGIGGEWAAGAAMVAEVVPEKRRVEAGTLLYTSSPAGLFLAAFVTYWVEHEMMPGQASVSWRYVFLFGLVPAIVAFVIRIFIKEPDRWSAVRNSKSPTVRELFSPQMVRSTISGLCVAVIALIMWWCCNAFIPTIASQLAQVQAKAEGLSKQATDTLVDSWKKFAPNLFNAGGLIGVLISIPISKVLGRKPMFAIYFLLSAIAVMATFGLDLAPHNRLYGYFFIGLTVYGVCGSFTYYLPELFPTRLRATGAGFCFNAGRFVAALGPFVVGSVAAMGQNSLETALTMLFWVGTVPIVGLFLLPLVIERKGRELED